MSDYYFVHSFGATLGTFANLEKRMFTGCKSQNQFEMLVEDEPPNLDGSSFFCLNFQNSQKKPIGVGPGFGLFWQLQKN
jgi:hypothetical protein